MRPGGWSVKGFLGPDESLTEVLDRDASTLLVLRVSYEDLAGGLERLLTAYQEVKQLALEEAIEADRTKPGVIDDAQFSRSLERVTATDPRFAVAEWNYLGSQTCPWSHDDVRTEWSSSSDWQIRNLRTGEQIPRPGMRGPGLIIHLIRDHHFFEGSESPYRVDPTELARLLELGPYAAHGSPPEGPGRPTKRD